MTHKLWLIRHVGYNTNAMDNTRFSSLLPTSLCLASVSSAKARTGVCPVPCNKLLLLQAEVGNYRTDQLRFCRPVARLWTQWVQLFTVRAHICTQGSIISSPLIYLHYACTSVQSTFVRTTKLTLQLHKALCNTAAYISHILTFLRISFFLPRWLKRSNTWVR